jgi:peroxiredoxin
LIPSKISLFSNMHRLHHLLTLCSLLALGQASASQEDALLIQKSYQLAVDKWALETRLATTPVEQAKAVARRPDATTAAHQMWLTLSGSLDQDWTLEPVAWFLRTTASLLTPDSAGVAKPVFFQENEAIRKAIQTYHLKSPILGPVCAALAATADPRALTLLEKIQATHPDPKVQGIAALAAAIQLKALGDDGELIRKRLTYLRKAIIQSSDADFDGTLVAKLAEEEIYIIRFLTKGRIAPELVGVDSGGRPLTLEAQKRKLIILLFWNSDVLDAQRVVEITTAMVAKYKGRPLAVVGVNNDPLEKLRTLQADSTVAWTNFSDPENKLAHDYRVGSWPLVYVLDGERKIQYIGAPGSFVELTADALLEKMPRK